MKHQHFKSKVCLVVKSPTLDERRLEYMFIPRGNPHLISQLCGVVLGPITNFKMVSEPIQDMLGRLSDFRYQATKVTLQMSSLGREGVC